MSIPLLLASLSEIYSIGITNPFEFIVNVALENANQGDGTSVLNTLDFDLLINATDESLAIA